MPMTSDPMSPTLDHNWFIEPGGHRYVEPSNPS
jgi:hypothetical protein